METSTNGGSDMSNSFFDPPLEIFIQTSPRGTQHQILVDDKDITNINKSGSDISKSIKASAKDT